MRYVLTSYSSPWPKVDFWSLRCLHLACPPIAHSRHGHHLRRMRTLPSLHSSPITSIPRTLPRTSQPISTPASSMIWSTLVSIFRFASQSLYLLNSFLLEWVRIRKNEKRLWEQKERKMQGGSEHCFLSVGRGMRGRSNSRRGGGGWDDEDSEKRERAKTLNCTSLLHSSARELLPHGECHILMGTIDW